MHLDILRKSRSIALYGLGREGTATLAFLQQHLPTIPVDIFESKDEENGIIPSLTQYSVVIVSSGIPPARFAHIPRQRITSHTNIFFDNLTEAARQKVIGITGTKGKSTTTTFLSALLTEAGYRAPAAGNIGIPLLTHFDNLIAGTIDYLVAELSSYQTEHLTVSPGIAIFLNLYRDHLDRHGTLHAYAKAKSQLWHHQTTTDLLITTPEGATYVQKTKPQARLIIAPPAPATLFPAHSLFRAAHFLDNFGTILALADYLHIPSTTIQATAQTFIGLPHRLQDLGIVRSIRWIDDAISTNPDSTAAGVRHLHTQLGSIILGGQDRRQRFTPLITLLATLGAPHIIVLHSHVSPRIIRTLSRLHYPCYSLARDLPEAIQHALQHTPPGHICLLSTAAPSYDTFKNFEEKGTTFQKCIQALTNQHASYRLPLAH